MVAELSIVENVKPGSIVEICIFGSAIGAGNVYRISANDSPEAKLMGKTVAYKQFTGEKVWLHSRNRCRVIKGKISGFEKFGIAGY